MEKEALEDKLNSILERQSDPVLDEEGSLQDEDLVPGANERPETRKARYRSLYVVHAAMLLISLGISIMLTGTLPYLKRVRE